MARPVLAALALALLGVPAAAQQRPAVVSDDAFRVCGDPANLPYSNQAEEGFENKIAHLVADEVKLPLRYYWMPTGPGFVRNTLGTKLCDVIIGYASGADVVQNTNAYYKSSYVLVTKAGGPLDGVDQLGDERLKDKRIGLVAATPPADYMLRYGLLAKAKSYPLVVDRRYDSPSEAMIADLVSGETDAAILWGPNGGYWAKKSGAPLAVTPLLKEKDGPPMSFRITFGIRHGELEWKRRLNELIAKKQGAIDQILLDYGVPLVDDLDRPITKARG
ncbi:substrate-binding domain-containing protein [Prosthecomicrobium sp. N25]|uniref:substrate-binding domain-containing protein n=1 Tax=Prosthecomicrobium sp. N25 TaxID=3129254 RepID=UPI00307764BB